ncbi:MAG TPA: hypothetical protein VMI74_16490 [Burkholderiales bacterium]|nr:hypothetical protein [Burkholderiales bacterium]
MLPELVEWESFYVIVGSSAGALIGLQFVVLTLIAEKPQLATPEGGAAYLTPTIVHFGTVLLLSAVLRVPWQAIGAFALAWGLVGLAGIAYVAVVNLRIRRQELYQAQLEDWLFHALIPFAAYALLALSALASSSYEREALFGVAAAVLLLLFCGIHNAWDVVAYHVFVRMRNAKEP